MSSLEKYLLRFCAHILIGLFVCINCFYILEVSLNHPPEMLCCSQERHLEKFVQELESSHGWSLCPELQRRVRTKER